MNNKNGLCFTYDLLSCSLLRCNIPAFTYFFKYNTKHSRLNICITHFKKLIHSTYFIQRIQYKSIHTHSRSSEISIF